MSVHAREPVHRSRRAPQAFHLCDITRNSSVHLGTPWGLTKSFSKWCLRHKPERNAHYFTQSFTELLLYTRHWGRDRNEGVKMPAFNLAGRQRHKTQHSPLYYTAEWQAQDGSDLPNSLVDVKNWEKTISISKCSKRKVIMSHLINEKAVLPRELNRGESCQHRNWHLHSLHCCWALLPLEGVPSWAWWTEFTTNFLGAQQPPL